MNLDAINACADDLVRNGIKVLQIHRFASDDVEHVKRLERWAEFPQNAHVVDLGSGMGCVAGIMHVIRPDCTFSLVNISEGQLKHSPEYMPQMLCSFLNVPQEDETYDAAMFCFSIGHEDHKEALVEAHRILKKDGVLFIYDMERISGSNESMESVEYTVLSRDELESIARRVGFRLDVFIAPEDNGDYGFSMLGDEYYRVFDGTIPAIWRFIKC